jgi:hypothetical protein
VRASVTPILNVPRKFNMCINLILGTLNFTTIIHRMNNLYNNERSYKQIYSTTSPKC